MRRSCAATGVWGLAIAALLSSAMPAARVRAQGLLQAATQPATQPETQQGGERGRPGGADAPQAVAIEKPYGAVHALCVGINQYASPLSGPDLRFAQRDAEAVSRAFAEKYGYAVTLLLGDQATRANIDARLNDLIATTGENDVLIFYFAGHGTTVLSSQGSGVGSQDSGGAGAAPPAPAGGKPVMEGYLLPQDIPLRVDNFDDEAIYRERAINMRGLTERLTSPAVKAKHVLLLLDCCASGMAVASRSGTGVGGPMSREYVSEIASKPTRQVITAGKGDQKAYEVVLDEAAGDGHGVFTHVLLQLLAKQSAQSVLGILPSLQQEVFDLVQKNFNARVIPQRKVLVDNGGDYVFIPAGAIDWRTDVQISAGPGAARGYEPTSDAEVQEVATAAQTAPPQQSLENDPKWQKRANELERKAAAGDPRAMEALVTCYRRGLGVPKNDERAYYWSTQAYESGDQRGAAMMAEFLKANVGTGTNVRNRKAAPAAADQLAHSLPPDVKKAVEAYNLVQTLAGNGDKTVALGAGGSDKDSANGGGATTRKDEDQDFGEMISSVWESLQFSDKASFAERLRIIEVEMARPRTDWDVVLKQLRAWADDIKTVEASVVEKDRPALKQLREHVDVLWRKARVHQKDELKPELDGAANVVRQLGDVGGGK